MTWLDSHRPGASGILHHITQRGNRRQETFCCAEDSQAYIALRGEGSRAGAGEGWADCLMPNQLHLMAVPDSEDGSLGAPEEEDRRLRRYERTGRPLGSEPFSAVVEGQLRRALRRGKPAAQGGRAAKVGTVSPEFDLP